MALETTPPGAFSLARHGVTRSPRGGDSDTMSLMMIDKLAKLRAYAERFAYNGHK